MKENLFINNIKIKEHNFFNIKSPSLESENISSELNFSNNNSLEESNSISNTSTNKINDSNENSESIRRNNKNNKFKTTSNNNLANFFLTKGISTDSGKKISSSSKKLFILSGEKNNNIIKRRSLILLERKDSINFSKLLNNENEKFNKKYYHQKLPENYFLSYYLNNEIYNKNINELFKVLLECLKSNQINYGIKLIIKLISSNKNNFLINQFLIYLEKKFLSDKDLIKNLKHNGNEKFYTFLINTMYFYKENSEIYNKSNEIHKYFIFKNFDYFSISDLNILIDFELYLYLVNENFYDEIYVFIKKILIDGIDIIIENINLNKINKFDKNISFFINILYEFIVIFSKQFLFNAKNINNLQDYMDLNSNNNLNVPKFLINGQENFSNNFDWNNNDLYIKILNLTEYLFDYKGFNNLISNEDNIEKITEELLFKNNNINQNYLIENFEFLVFIDLEGKIPLLKIIFMLLIIRILFLITKNDKLKNSLEIYEKKFYFIIIISCKYFYKKEKTDKIYEIILQIILFEFLFLEDNLDNPLIHKTILKLLKFLFDNIYSKYLINNFKISNIKNIPIFNKIFIEYISYLYNYLKNKNKLEVKFKDEEILQKILKKFDFHESNLNINSKNKKIINDNLKNLFDTLFIFKKYQKRYLNTTKIIPIYNLNLENENKINDDNNKNINIKTTNKYIKKNYIDDKENLFKNIIHYLKFYEEILKENDYKKIKNKIKKNNYFNKIK